MSADRADELRAAARVAVAAAVAVLSSFVASKAARDAILLSSFDVEQLPLFVGLSAALSLPLVLLAGRLFIRFSPGRLLPVMNLASAILLIGEWLLARGEPRVAAVIVFLHLGSFGAVLVSGFWSIITERFDVQSAKRYVGRIGVGATLGGILGSVIAERAAVYLEANAILAVLAILQAACAFVLRKLATDEPARRPPPEALTPLASLRTIARTSLLRNLAFVIVLSAIGAAALDYVFKAEVVRASHGGMLRMFALYHLGTSAITALIQLLVAQRVLRGLGVARTVGTLPITVTGFGLAAVLAGGFVPAMLARGAEAVMRSSVFRAGYELLYAPLPDDQKRSTKVVLDVGAERVGDLLGAQLVALVVYLAPTHTPVLIAGVCAGVLAFAFASRVPRAYTAALASSLVAQTKDEPEVPNVRLDDPLRFTSLGSPSMTETGADLTALSLLGLKAADIRVLGAEPVVHGAEPVVHGAEPVVHEIVMPVAPRKPERSRPAPSESIRYDETLEHIAALRSRDLARIREVLAGDLTPELVPHILPLVAWDEIAPAALTALVPIAPRCTGMIVDALLDPDREFAIRRRLPAVLTAGDPQLAAWGLWRAISDARFEVRYRCGRALLELREAGHPMPFEVHDIHRLVERELSVERTVLHSYRLLDATPNLGEHPDRSAEGIANDASAMALAHICNMFALALPPDPVRIAFQSLHATDRELRATALEYLESALPPHLVEKLWPLIDVQVRPPSSSRTREELAVALRMSQPLIEKLGVSNDG
jgi:AAA family ATP:ADP antiporter